MFSSQDLIDAAPWMFTLLAESSLAARRRQLDAFAELEKSLPPHLSHASAALEETRLAEINSIAARDVFGAEHFANDPAFPPFHPSETNPFFEYLAGLAEAANSKEIDPSECLFLSGTLPRWPVFRAWWDKLTNGDGWAEYAIEHGYARVDDIPEELRPEDRAIDRAAWLASTVPANERERVEAKRAELAIDLDLDDGEQQ